MREAVEVARGWSNGKTFQIAVHTMRGNLTPVEAGTALVERRRGLDRHGAVGGRGRVLAGRAAGGGVATVVLGDLASGETAPGGDLDVLFLYADGSPRHHEIPVPRVPRGASRAVARQPAPRAGPTRAGVEDRALARRLRRPYHRTEGAAAELLDLARARCVFTSGNDDLSERFERARRDVLAHGAARDRLVAELREAPGDAPAPGPLAFEDMRGGLRDVERAARLLHVAGAADPSDTPAPSAASLFKAAGESGRMPREAAERLAEAAATWRNLRGILRLVADDDLAAETAGPKVEAVIARACGSSGFDALIATVRETAAGAAADIDANAA